MLKDLEALPVWDHKGLLKSAAPDINQVLSCQLPDTKYEKCATELSVNSAHNVVCVLMCVTSCMFYYASHLRMQIHPFKSIFIWGSDLLLHTHTATCSIPSACWVMWSMCLLPLALSALQNSCLNEISLDKWTSAGNKNPFLSAKQTLEPPTKWIPNSWITITIAQLSTLIMLKLTVQNTHTSVHTHTRT